MFTLRKLCSLYFALKITSSEIFLQFSMSNVLSFCASVVSLRKFFELIVVPPRLSFWIPLESQSGTFWYNLPELLISRTSQLSRDCQKTQISTKNSTLQRWLSDLVALETEKPAPKRSNPPMVTFSNRTKCPLLIERTKNTINTKGNCASYMAQNPITCLLDVTLLFVVQINASALFLDAIYFHLALDVVISQ